MQGAYRLQENDMFQIMAKSTLCRNLTKKKEFAKRQVFTTNIDIVLP